MKEPQVQARPRGFMLVGCSDEERESGLEFLSSSNNRSLYILQYYLSFSYYIHRNPAHWKKLSGRYRMPYNAL